MHPRKFYLQHYKKGVQFLGVYIKPYRIYIGKRSKSNFYNKIEYWNGLNGNENCKIDNESKFLLRAQVNSYLGLMKHYNTYKLRRKYIGLLNMSAKNSFFTCNEELNKMILLNE